MQGFMGFISQEIIVVAGAELYDAVRIRATMSLQAQWVTSSFPAVIMFLAR